MLNLSLCGVYEQLLRTRGRRMLFCPAPAAGPACQASIRSVVHGCRCMSSCSEAELLLSGCPSTWCTVWAAHQQHRTAAALLRCCWRMVRCVSCSPTAHLLWSKPLGAPGGTKGTLPVAMITSFAVTWPPTSTRPGRPYLMVWLSTNLAEPIRMSCNAQQAAARQQTVVALRHRRGPRLLALPVM
jgi:hypothetical protein